MQTVLMYAPEDLPPIPDDLYQEYATFGGGTSASQTHNPDYVPQSYWAAMQARAAKYIKRAAVETKKRLARQYLA